MGVRVTGKVSFNGKKQTSRATVKPMSFSMNDIVYHHRENNADQIATTILKKEDVEQTDIEQDK